MNGGQHEVVHCTPAPRRRGVGGYSAFKNIFRKSAKLPDQVRVSGFILNIKSTMKKTRTLLILAFGTSLFLAPFVHAEDNSTPPPDGRRARMMKRMEKHTIKELGLTADQEARWKEIGQKQRAAMEAIRNDGSLSQDDRRAKAADTMKQFDDQRRALLTADQQKKFDEIRQEQRERWQGRRGGHDAPSPADGNPPPEGN
jgi:protein CpxP